MHICLLLLAHHGIPYIEVFHASGTLKDSIFQNQSVGSIKNCSCAQKSVLLLDWNATFATNQRYACSCFSSIAALLGSRGQTNYVAANSCLDSLGYKLHTRGIPTTSIQWGAWRTKNWHDFQLRKCRNTFSLECG